MRRNGVFFSSFCPWWNVKRQPSSTIFIDWNVFRVHWRGEVSFSYLQRLRVSHRQLFFQVMFRIPVLVVDLLYVSEPPVTSNWKALCVYCSFSSQYSGLHSCAEKSGPIVESALAESCVDLSSRMPKPTLCQPRQCGQLAERRDADSCVIVRASCAFSSLVCSRTSIPALRASRGNAGSWTSWCCFMRCT